MMMMLITIITAIGINMEGRITDKEDKTKYINKFNDHIYISLIFIQLTGIYPDLSDVYVFWYFSRGDLVWSRFSR